MSNYEKMSPPEREVSELLDKLGILWKYEYPLFVYDDMERPRTYAPDFFLPKLGLFVEVCGSSKIDYSYREKVFKKNSCQVIFVHHYKEPDRWKSFLIQRLYDLQEQRLIETEKPLKIAKEMGIEFQVSI